MRIFTNTTHTTVGDLSENPTNATSETNEDTSSIGPGNDASKEVILAAGIVDIITAGISLTGFLGQLNVNQTQYFTKPTKVLFMLTKSKTLQLT